jgi:hypothetical protein
VERKVRRLGLLAAALAVLAGCSDSGGDDEQAGFEGLDAAIATWRTEIIASHESCRETVRERACQAFEVTCKVAGELTPADRAAGATSKVMASIRWLGWDPAKKEMLPASTAAAFSKVGDSWRRTPASVNPTTCASY